MIDGKTIRLRSWREDDLEKLTDMRNDIATQSQLLSRVRGSNCEQTRKWLVNRCTSPDSILLIITDKKEDGVLGYIQFLEIEPVDRHAKMGICLSLEFQGKGIGREVIKLALEYLHTSFAVRKVFLKVRSDNERAIGCYESLGFTKCGVLHKHYYADNRWYDIAMMELFLNEPV